jgi:hypothetical protein
MFGWLKKDKRSDIEKLFDLNNKDYMEIVLNNLEEMDEYATPLILIAYRQFGVALDNLKADKIIKGENFNRMEGIKELLHHYEGKTHDDEESVEAQKDSWQKFAGLICYAELLSQLDGDLSDDFAAIWDKLIWNARHIHDFIHDETNCFYLHSELPMNMLDISDELSGMLYAAKQIIPEHIKDNHIILETLSQLEGSDEEDDEDIDEAS